MRERYQIMKVCDVIQSQLKTQIKYKIMNMIFYTTSQIISFIYIFNILII